MKKSTSSVCGTQVRKSRGYTRIYSALLFPVLLAILFVAGCKKDTFKGEIKGTCPVVVSTDPMEKAVDVVLDKVISITFNTSMSAASINKTTVTIKQGGTLVAGTIAPTANGAVFTFKPDVPLLPFTVYTGTVTTGATDTLRSAIANAYVWSFTTIPQVTLSALPEIGGITAGAGTFAQGSAATVTATPNAGYVFISWTDNGVIASKSSSYQFTMAGNRMLVANFTKVNIGSFAVVLSSSPVAGGTTAGAGSYNAGSTVTVTATPAIGYTFMNWTDNGAAVSNSPSYHFILAGNRTLVANFKIIPASQFAVVLSSNPAEGGTTTGSGAYAAGTSVTVTATKNNGYSFTSWTENGTVVSNSPSYTFPLSANRTLVANFALNTYTLNVTATHGSVAKTPNQATYNSGTAVELKATPAAGYKFSSWSGDASGSTNPLVVTMNANKTIVANFTSNTFTLKVTAVNGSVVKTPNQAGYNNGSIVQLKATPKPGYTFVSWSGDASGSINPLNVTMNANKVIAANFTLLPPIGPGPVNLGLAGNYNMLTKTGISTTGTTSIEGNLGVSPAAATAITGFGLIMDASGQFSRTPIVTGKVYAADYAAPTPSNLTTAVNNMQTAYTTANGLVTPAPIVDLGAGNISGKILPPGLYKWSTGVLITNAGVTLSGGPNDTWVFQISQNLTINNSAHITLLGGAQAKNIVWVVAGQATLGSNVDFTGIILSKTLISLNTGTKVRGRLLAQTAVTLNANTVVLP